MLAREMMTAAPMAVTMYEAITQAARLMAQYDVGILPVIDDQVHRRLVGVITDRDLVVRCLSEGHTFGCHVEDHLTRDPLITVTPDDTIETIAERMGQYQVRRVPVVEGPDKRLVGIVTMADLLRHAGKTHAELLEQLDEKIHRPGMLVP